MERFQAFRGRVALLNRVNVDTDQIIPKQFLKRIERTGFGQFLFYDWRFEEDGKTLRPDFELNLPQNQGASVLVAGANFGCGSSREHAPWALLDFGFRVIIAPSFADIFFNNCFKNGILLVTLEGMAFESLLEWRKENAPAHLRIDLDAQKIETDNGETWYFELDSFRKMCLLEGLDDIALTLQQEEAISHYEREQFPSF